MLPQHFNELIHSQCAICAFPFHGGSTKAIKLRVINSDTEPTGVNELFNMEVLAYIFRMSIPKLAFTMLNNLKNVVSEEDYIGVSSILQDYSISQIASILFLCLCELCAAKFAELYVVNYNFLKHLSKDSFVAKAIAVAEDNKLPNICVQSSTTQVNIDYEHQLRNINDVQNNINISNTNPNNINMEIPLEVSDEHKDGDVPPRTANSKSERVDLLQSCKIQDQLPNRDVALNQSDQPAATGASLQEINTTESVKTINRKVKCKNYSLRIKLSGPPYLCPISACEEEKLSFEQLKIHCRKTHGVSLLYHRGPKKHYCDICLLSCDTLMDFEIHCKKLHSNAATECVKMCQRCTLEFKSESALNEHSLNVHKPQLQLRKCRLLGNIKYRCLRCMASFLDIKELKIHENTLHKASYKKLKSSEVSKNPKFSFHREIIKGPPYKCPKCSIAFAEIKYLKSHCCKMHLLLIPIQKNEVATDINVTCLECSQLLLNMDGLNKHYRQTHKLPFVCNICRKAFSEQTLLEVHDCKKYLERNSLLQQSTLDTIDRTVSDSENQTEESSLKQVIFCSYCDISFENINTYKTHVQQQHKEEFEQSSNIKCPKCFQQCATQPALKLHLKRHSPNFPKLRCEFCDKDFLALGSLTTHRNAYHRKELVLPLIRSMCPVCNRAFKRKADLKEHLKSRHTLLRPHECDICHMKFKDTKTLKKHKVIHTDKKMFKCTQCDMSFHSKNVMKNHMMIHFDERPFVCETCGKSFRRKSTLQDHYLSHKKGAKFAFCDTCGAGFKTRKYMKSHARRCHTDGEKPRQEPEDELLQGPRKRPLCDKTLKNMKSLRVHMSWKHSHNASNQYKCSFCEHVFRGKMRLKQHILYKHRPEKQSPGPEVINTIPNINCQNSNIVEENGAEFEAVEGVMVFEEADVCKLINNL